MNKVRRTQRVHYVQVSQVIHPQKEIFKARATKEILSISTIQLEKKGERKSPSILKNSDYSFHFGFAAEENASESFTFHQFLRRPEKAILHSG